MTMDYIIRRMNSGIAKAVRAGMKPNEVWLGKEEFQIFADEVGVYGGVPVSSHAENRINGLTVRESHLPGVRVGASWDGDDD